MRYLHGYHGVVPPTALSALVAQMGRSTNRSTADQAGMMAVNRAVEALADDPAPPGAFVRGAYRRLRVGPDRVLDEVEGNLITIVRIDRV